jgi:hypothetical protein
LVPVNILSPLLDMRGNPTLVHSSTVPILQAQFPVALVPVLVEVLLSVALVLVAEVLSSVALPVLVPPVVAIRVD